MIPAPLVLALATAVWFGPVQVSFDLPAEGNPYDFRVNDVRVEFVAADGTREERLAYYDEGRWHAWLTAQRSGSYRALIRRNGAALDRPAQEVVLTAQVPMRAGFVRVEGSRFVSDDGSPYFPLGHNLGWNYAGQPTIPEQLQSMGNAGMNWSRIWACTWDGKNPFFTRGQPPPPLGELQPAVLRRWDEIIAAAEAAGIRIQMVLFHHGLVSSRNDANWDEHAWRRANGGFLDRPQEFFTDARAKEFQKRWLRHAIARWGHSPAVMAWELFNEVEWVDTVQIDHDWPTIVGWHAEMAEFVRELDPYRHLVTTSSAKDRPGLYAAMDFAQPHTYPRDVFNGIAGVPPLPGKPWFFGEFGRGTWEEHADERLVVRDGLWAGILSGHAGAAQYWFWERVTKLGLTVEFTRAVRAIAMSQLLQRRCVVPVAVTLAGAPRAPLTLAPGRGWGRTERYRFVLPDDATPQKLAEWSAFLNPHHGENGAETREPVEFVFALPEAGEAEVTFASLAARGAGLRIWVDGRETAKVEWPAADDSVLAPTGGRRHQAAPAPVRVPMAPGHHTLRLESVGPDWVQVDRLSIPGIGSAVRAHGIAEPGFALVRLQADQAAIGCELTMTIPGLSDGGYRVQSLDLNTGAETHRTVAVNESQLVGLRVEGTDSVLSLARE